MLINYIISLRLFFANKMKQNKNETEQVISEKNIVADIILFKNGKNMFSKKAKKDEEIFLKIINKLKKLICNIFAI